MPSLIPAAIVGSIGAAGSIASSAIQSNAAQSAAQTQANAANQAAATQLQMYNTTRGDLQPFLNTGTSALQQLSSIWGLGGSGGSGTGTPNAQAAMNALTQFPGYQFGLQQGQTALDQSAASQGLLLSGAQLQASQQFGNNYALSQAWSPYISGLTGLSQLGENAGALVGNAGTATGAQVGSSLLAAGQAGASGIVGSANAITGGLSNALNQGSLAYLLSQQGSNASLAAQGGQLLSTYGPANLDAIANGN